MFLKKKVQETCLVNIFNNFIKVKFFISVLCIYLINKLTVNNVEEFESKQYNTLQYFKYTNGLG